MGDDVGSVSPPHWLGGLVLNEMTDELEEMK